MRSRFALALLLAAGWTQAAELNGSLKLFANGQPLRAAEASEAVIYFRPKAPLPLPPGKALTMVTRRKQFVPRVLTVTAGDTVRFPNEDPILHNAFSTSAGNSFDTGQYGRGDGKAQLFDKPGLVRVYCNVHHSMFGFILVLDTPFHTRSDGAGKFRLADLPEGEGELVVFHDRGAPLKQTLVISRNSTIDLRLDLNKRRVPAHTNKFGKPYARTPNANY